ncbi:MAG: hypothetical protein AAF950_17255 [Pseudomonadota bacterium]
MNHEKAQAVLDRTPKDEPVFVLRAQDAFAIGLVAQWVSMAEVACISDEKVEGARNDLRLFGGWLDAGGQTKIPD